MGQSQGIPLSQVMQRPDWHQKADEMIAAQNARGGNPMTESEKYAIQYAANQQYGPKTMGANGGFQPAAQTTNLDPNSQAEQQAIQQQSAQTNSAAQNFALAAAPEMLRGMAAPQRIVQGLLDPRSTVQGEQALNFAGGSAASGIASGLGRAAGQALGMVPQAAAAMAVAPVAPALMGLQSAAESRIDTALRRSSGEQISTGAELGDALTQGVIGWAAGHLTTENLTKPGALAAVKAFARQEGDALVPAIARSLGRAVQAGTLQVPIAEVQHYAGLVGDWLSGKKNLDWDESAGRILGEFVGGGVGHAVAEPMHEQQVAQQKQQVSNQLQAANEQAQNLGAPRRQAADLEELNQVVKAAGPELPQKPIPSEHDEIRQAAAAHEQTLRQNMGLPQLQELKGRMQEAAKPYVPFPESPEALQKPAGPANQSIPVSPESGNNGSAPDQAVKFSGKYTGQSDPAYVQEKQGIRAQTFDPGTIVHGGILQDAGTIAKNGIVPSALSGRVDAEQIGPTRSATTAAAYAGKGARGTPVLYELSGVKSGVSDGGVNAVDVNSPGQDGVSPEHIKAVILPDGQRLTLEQAARLSAPGTNSVPPVQTKAEPDFFSSVAATGAKHIANLAANLAANEEGGLTPPEMLKRTGEEIGENLAKKTQDFKDGIAPKLAAIGWHAKSAVPTVHNLTELQGKNAVGRFQVASMLEPGERYMASLSDEERQDFVDRHEAGLPQPNADLQTISNTIRAINDHQFHELDSRDISKGYIADYMSGAAKNPDDPTAQANLQKWLQSNMSGNLGFSKTRKIPNWEERRAMGFEPLSDNPVTQARMDMVNKSRAINVHDQLQALHDMGTLVAYGPKDTVPPGMVEANPLLGRVYKAPDTQEGEAQKWYTNKANATLLEQYLPAKGQSAMSAALKGMSRVGGLMTQANTAMSFLHAVTSIGRSINQSMTGAVQAAINGEGLGGIGRRMADSFNLAQNDVYLKGLADPSKVTPEMAPVIDMLKKMDVQPPIPTGQSTLKGFGESFVDKMVRNLREGNTILAGFQVPPALADATSHLLNRTLIPNLKFAAAIQMAKTNLESAGPETTDADLRQMGYESRKNLDARFGHRLMETDYTDKGMKQLAQALLRAPGWTAGPLETTYRAMQDIVRLGRGTQVGPAHALTYAITGTITAAAINGLVQHTLTGAWPQDWKDWLYPKTGIKDKDGNDIRADTRSEASEVQKLGSAPATTLLHKANPVITLAMEAFNNKDFYGHQIWDPSPDANHWANSAAVAAHILGGASPFTASTFAELEKRGATPGQAAAFTQLAVPARKSLDYSPARQKAQDWLDSQEKAATPAPTGNEPTKKPGKAVTFGANSLDQAIEDGTVPKGQSYYLRGLQKDVLAIQDWRGRMEVWRAGNKEEQAALLPLLVRELAHDKRAPDRLKMLEELNGVK
jgi:hypothetical protein